MVRTPHVTLLVTMPAQSHQALCHPMDSSPSGSSVRGFFQARTLEAERRFHQNKEGSGRVSCHPVLTPIPPPPEAETTPACESSPVEADNPRSSARTADTAVCGVTSKAVTTPAALARPREHKGEKHWFCSWEPPTPAPLQS